MKLKIKSTRFSFCATPLNDTALMVLGGWGVDGALDSVQVFGLMTDDGDGDNYGDGDNDGDGDSDGKSDGDGDGCDQVREDINRK